MRRLFLIILPFCLSAAAFAQPADPDLPLPDPPGVWRKITHDDATSDSKCIGNPVTPLCALETYFACFLRSRNDFCDMVEAGVRFSTGRKHPATLWQEYRIAYARRPSKLDPVDRTTEGPLKALPGDVIIAVFRRDCYSVILTEGLQPCDEEIAGEPPNVYMLRKQGDLWTNPYHFKQRY